MLRQKVQRGEQREGTDEVPSTGRVPAEARDQQCEEAGEYSCGGDRGIMHDQHACQRPSAQVSVDGDNEGGDEEEYQSGLAAAAEGCTHGCRHGIAGDGRQFRCRMHGTVLPCRHPRDPGAYY